MKKALLLIFGIVAIASTALFPATTYIYDYQVSINSTTATVVSGPRVGRKYYLAVNTGSYDVYQATYSLKPADINNLLLVKNYGYWEENYLCYVSSYYAISTGGPSTLKIREKE